jgi:hypothetical protein
MNVFLILVLQQDTLLENEQLQQRFIQMIFPKKKKQIDGIF